MTFGNFVESAALPSLLENVFNANGWFNMLRQLRLEYGGLLVALRLYHSLRLELVRHNFLDR